VAGRTVMVGVVVLALQGAASATVQADGLPVVGFASAAHGIRTPDGARRYVALPQRHQTIVKAISSTGRTLTRSVLHGRFGVPVVAYDGSAAGLSANGRTLVLIRPRTTFPQHFTELAILAAQTLRPRRLERLRGDFSFDAISADGKWVYLIQYASRSDPTRYRVRALSTRTGQLLARDIVDPHDRGEKMRGSPITRVGSANGRWAYTLYDGNGHPFVHALDTANVTARCIDLPAFPTNSDTWQARLRLVGTKLIIVLGGQTLSELDTASLSLLAHVRAASTNDLKAAARSGHAATRSRSMATRMMLPIAAALLLLTVAVISIRRRFAARPDSRRWADRC
jgi:hypothetical protein